MAKTLGPSFSAELLAAFGGPVNGLAWGGDDTTIMGRESLTAPQSALLDQVIAAHVPPTALDIVKDVQVAMLRAACAAEIVGGFTSSALGSPRTYPSDETSQRNLSGSVLASILPSLPTGWTTPFWNADASGHWDFTPHTAAQIQQVGLDGKALVVNAQGKLAALTAQVKLAATAQAVQAVAW